MDDLIVKEVKSNSRVTKLDSKNSQTEIAINQLRWSFYPLDIIKILVIIIAVLFSLSLTVTFLKYFSGVDSIVLTFFYKQFDLDLEGNIPAYFSALLHLFSSFILFFIYRIFRSKTRYWLFLSALFMFLSVDEAIQIHEKFNMIKPKFELLKEGTLKYVWVFPYLIFLSLLFLSMKTFLSTLPLKTRNWFILSAIVFIGGAMGVEVIHDYLKGLNGGEENLYLELLITLEEIGEMTGVTMFIYALLNYISPGTSPISVSCER